MSHIRSRTHNKSLTKQSLTKQSLTKQSLTKQLLKPKVTIYNNVNHDIDLNLDEDFSNVLNKIYKQLII
jgi:hypothetical protein